MLPRRPTVQALARFSAKLAVARNLWRDLEKEKDSQDQAQTYEGALEPTDAWNGPGRSASRGARERLPSTGTLLSQEQAVREANKPNDDDDGGNDGALFTPRFYQDVLRQHAKKPTGDQARYFAPNDSSGQSIDVPGDDERDDDTNLPLSWGELSDWQQMWQTKTLLGGDNVDDQFVEVTCGMTKSSPARKHAIQLLRNRYFEFTVMMAVVVNTIILACTPPSKADGLRSNVAEYSEIVFTVLFTIEMGIKVFALGFNQYIKSGYNMLDFTVVVSGWLPIIIGLSGNLAVLRVLRVLRSLRTMSVFKGVRMMLENTLVAATQVLNITPLASFVFTIFGVMGVQLFMGSLRRRCVNVEKDEILGSDTDIQTCSLVNHTVWGGYLCPANYTCQGGFRNPSEGAVNFDNTFYASVTIFQIITLEGWTDIMYLIQDATTGWACFYFISIVVIGSFFLMNLVLAVITEVFTQSVLMETLEDAKSDPRAMVEKQIFRHANAWRASLRAWFSQWIPFCINLLARCVPRCIKQRYHPMAGLFYQRVLMHRRFEMGLVALIIVNAVVLAMEHDGMSKGYSDTLETINLVFVIIFAIETLIRFIVLGFKKWARNRFNIFDGIVVTLSILGYIRVGTQFTAFRVFRAFHLLRLIRAWRRMQLYAVLIGQMLYKLLDFLFFLTIALVVFTITGMQLFGGEYGSGPDRPRRHFDSFLEALLTVFQVFTGENWNELMYTGIHYIGWGAAVYFIILICVGTYFIVNVFLGILLANFAAAEKFRDLSGAVTSARMEEERAAAAAAADNDDEKGLGEGPQSPGCRPKSPLQPLAQAGEPYSTQGANASPLQKVTDDMGVQNGGVSALADASKTAPWLPLQKKLAGIGALLQLGRQLSRQQSLEESPPPTGTIAIRLSHHRHHSGSTGLPESDPWTGTPPDRHLAEAESSTRDKKGQGPTDESSLSLQERQGSISRLPTNSFLEFKDLVMSRDSAPSRTNSKQARFRNTDRGSFVSEPRAALSPGDVVTSSESGSPRLARHRSPRSPRSHDSFGASVQLRAELDRFLSRPKSLVRGGLFMPGDGGLLANLSLRRFPGSQRDPEVTKPPRPDSRRGHTGDRKDGGWSVLRADLAHLGGDPVAAQERRRRMTGRFIEQLTSARAATMTPKSIDEKEPSLADEASILTGKQRVQRWLRRIILHPWFEHVVLVLIFFSSILLAVESPGVEDHNPRLSRFLGVMEIIFTVTFSIEILAKMLVLGLWGGRHGYFKDPFNLIDCVVVILSVLALVVSNQIRTIRSLRVVRVLRPLRVISRLPEVKVVVNALLLSFPAVVNLLLLDLVFFIMYGILGMKLFSGKFKYCNDKEAPDRQSCNGTFAPPGPNGTLMGEVPRVWTESHSNFDNIFFSLVTLFHMSTTEGWVDVMELGMKCAHKTDPERNCTGGGSFFVTLYFIFFMLLSSFILVNMFIGVVVDSFLSLNSKQSVGSLMLTEGQLKWLQLQKMVLSTGAMRRPVMPRSAFRAYFFRLVNTTLFKAATTLVIIVNSVFLMLRYFDMSESWSDMLDIVDQVCTYLFLVELLLKMIAFFPRVFFSSAWRCFDFVLVISSLFANVNVLRVFRIARSVRMMPYFPSLLIQLQTLVYAAPSMMNVGSLLFMVFYIYATTGVALFGRIEIQGALDRHANFKNFGRAMLTLARISTGESWHEIMFSLMVRPPHCGDKGPNNDPEANKCGNVYFPPVYFISFVIFGCFIFLNMFIAVILESFDYTKVDVQDTSLPPGTVQRFMATWSKMDPHATGFIPVTQLQPLFRQMEPPLRFPAHVLRSRLAMMKMYKDLPTTKHGVFFTDVFRLLAGYAIGAKGWQLNELPDELAQNLDDRFRQARLRKLKRLKFRSRDVRDTQMNDCLNPLLLQQESVPAEVMEGVITLQARVKGFLVRKNLKDMLGMEAARVHISGALAEVGELIAALEKVQASEKPDEPQLLFPDSNGGLPNAH